MPWARANSGITRLFEALAITLCRHTPVHMVAGHLGVGDAGLWCILHHFAVPRSARAPTAVRLLGAGSVDGGPFYALRRVCAVIQLANAAVDEVRRAEVREEPILKHSRWTWLKDKNSWSERHITTFHSLSRLRLKTARAWRLKEPLREIFSEASSQAEAEEQLSRWYTWARRCRLAPFKRLALTLKAHWQGVLNAFDSRLNNGGVEGLNSLIQAAKARARGYRTARNLITIAYLIGAKLRHLPASPYTTTSCVRAACP